MSTSACAYAPTCIPQLTLVLRCAGGLGCRALFLVMHADAAELEPALRRRVDGMVAAGLVQELEALAAAAAVPAAGTAAAAALVGAEVTVVAAAGAGEPAMAEEACSGDDSGRGVQQSSGFHEWGADLRARGFAWGTAPSASADGAAAGAAGVGDTVGKPDMEALRNEAVEAMKADTCRLARRQGLTLVHFSAQIEPFVVVNTSTDPSYATKRAYVEPRSGRV